MVIRAFLKNNKILQNKIFIDKKKKKKENQKIKKKQKSNYVSYYVEFQTWSSAEGTRRKLKQVFIFSL